MSWRCAVGLLLVISSANAFPKRSQTLYVNISRAHAAGENGTAAAPFHEEREVVGVANSGDTVIYQYDRAGVTRTLLSVEWRPTFGDNLDSSIAAATLENCHSPNDHPANTPAAQLTHRIHYPRGYFRTTPDLNNPLPVDFIVLHSVEADRSGFVNAVLAQQSVTHTGSPRNARGTTAHFWVSWSGHVYQAATTIRAVDHMEPENFRFNFQRVRNTSGGTFENFLWTIVPPYQALVQDPAGTQIAHREFKGRSVGNGQNVLRSNPALRITITGLQLRSDWTSATTSSDVVAGEQLGTIAANQPLAIKAEDLSNNQLSTDTAARLLEPLLLLRPPTETAWPLIEEVRFLKDPGAASSPPQWIPGGLSGRTATTSGTYSDATIDVPADVAVRVRVPSPTGNLPAVAGAGTENTGAIVTWELYERNSKTLLMKGNWPVNLWVIGTDAANLDAKAPDAFLVDSGNTYYMITNSQALSKANSGLEVVPADMQTLDPLGALDFRNLPTGQYLLLVTAYDLWGHTDTVGIKVQR